MRLQAVLFDLDDTLLIDEAASEATFKRVATWATERYPQLDPQPFSEAAQHYANHYWTQGPGYAYCEEIGISAFECLWGTFHGEDDRLRILDQWIAGFRRSVWAHALQENGVIDAHFAETCAQQFAQWRRDNVQLMPGVSECLALCREHYKVGLLTNGSPSLQRDKIALAGLETSFDAIAISGEVQIGKPQPKIFHWLLNELGVCADHAVMVGNSLERDIAGAHHVKMTNIWLHVPGAEGGDRQKIHPHFTFTHWKELPALLQKISKTKEAPPTNKPGSP